ncbi:EF-hand [Punctularia strigosozonata HHB-11173 SS5]|uniref:EF-hand n=1 Tax=Punctularia strigosozonata (strain HHB-11173) TaxID=741275 RepID=UPI0004416774|nr:EF-hand [Punctularia strigosozonata HHB-11173 SS5]EIN07732.1 EF-hand [Punctularia strigosozonata HHB-11173 SS5]
MFSSRPSQSYGAQLQHTPSNASYRPPPQRYSTPYGGGGYGPPPGADPQLWQWFSSVDVDRSGSISVTELQRALVNGNWTNFDLDTVKMLMNIFDTDRSGTIGFAEFSGLWKYIADWQNVFRHFDKDRSGSIEGPELSAALRSFGYNLSPSILSLIEQKYATGPSEGYGPPPGITFDRFVRACVVVKTLTESFQRIDTDRDGWITVNYEQFMKIVLQAP